MWTLLALAVCQAPLEAREAPREKAPPNIIVVLVDDLGYGDLGADVPGVGGRSDHRTPHITAFAKSALVFTDAYSAGPNCAPSRASLQTGRFTPRHRVITVGSSARGKAAKRRLVPVENQVALDASEVTIAEHVAERGYQSIHLGKWHLGEDPRTQGYDLNVGGNKRGHPPSYVSPYKNPDLPDGPEGEYLTNRLTDEAIGFLDAQTESSAPFLMHLAYYTVHTPLRGPAAAVEARRTAGVGDQTKKALNYGAMVETLDAEFGRVLAALESKGLAKNTVVIFTSDNGGYGPVTNRQALRGCKGTLDEGGVRVPLFVRWPERIAHRIESTPVHHVDLFPTIGALAGAGPRPVDGLALNDLFVAADAGSVPSPVPSIERGYLAWHFPAYLQGKSDRFETFRTTPGGSLRSGDWKVIEYFEGRADGSSHVELYNLRKDPQEAKDVFAEEPERAASMMKALWEWRASVGARMPTRPATPKAPR